MSKPQVVIAMYRPKEEKIAELEELIRRHFPILRQYGLTTDRPPMIGRSKDGTFVEIFEWVSPESAVNAHDHPAVAKIWEAMALVCDFGRLEQLPEAKAVFPKFEVAF